MDNWQDQKRIIDLSVIVIVWSAKWNFAYGYFSLVILWLTSRRESLLLIHSDDNLNCKEIFNNHKQPKYTCKGMKKYANSINMEMQMWILNLNLLMPHNWLAYYFKEYLLLKGLIFEVDKVTSILRCNNLQVSGAR